MAGKSEPTYLEIGERIKSRRKALGISQEGLAKSVGLSRVSIVNIECGRQRMPVHVLQKITGELGLKSFVSLMEQVVETPAKRKYVGQVSRTFKELGEVTCDAESPSEASLKINAMLQQNSRKIVWLTTRKVQSQAVELVKLRKF